MAIGRTFLAAALLGLLELSGAVAERQALAYDPPPQASLAAAIEQTLVAIRLSQQIGPAVGLDASALGPVEACNRLVAPVERCSGVDLGPCWSGLVGLRQALRSAAGRTSDPFAGAAAGHAATMVEETVLRLAVARDSLARDECDWIAPAGGFPVRNVPSGDGRNILVEPLVPLRVGRRYALVVDGLPEPAIAALRSTVVPVAAGSSSSDAVSVPAGSFSELVDSRAGGASGIDRERWSSLLRRLESESAMPGLPPFSGARITLPEPLTDAQLATFRAYFAPARSAPASHTIASFHTFDFRPGLAAYRGAITAKPCAEGHAEAFTIAALSGPGHTSIGGVVRGEYRSLDIRSGDHAGAFGTPPAEAPAVLLRYVLALPSERTSATALVIVINGIGGKGADMLADHADGLTSRGMAVLAIDLPDHGERAVPGQSFLDVTDPARLALNLRQSVVDVMAVVHAAKSCGLSLPDGERFVPADVRYAGYSLGAMVGSIVRSVEPDLGTTVLFAPGADLLGWLVLNLGASLGSDVATCIGGPQSGHGCGKEGHCDDPGTCYVNPFMARLLDLARLPYHLASAPGDPLSFAVGRTGAMSHAPLLLITGGEDAILTPILPTRLADALGMKRIAEHKRRGPHSVMVQWPRLAHNLVNHPSAREQAYTFLATRGRRLLPVHGGAPPGD
ncbi:MAG TPA: hypothetical protein VEI94_03005 [Candidatus Bathyarchaeia archaeon]|nr:hypothetical protein [Candidatus Bathyarchaeia archaeon]